MTRIPALLVAFAVAAVGLGLLTAAIALPAVAGLGRLALAGADTISALPASFATTPLAQGSRILAADGSLIATPQRQGPCHRAPPAVAPVMRQAQVAIEDSRFYSHGAIDPEGIARAARGRPPAGQATQGASTLTQQFVKLSLRSRPAPPGGTRKPQAATAKTLVRKLTELEYATTLERRWTKDQILAGYLNIAYYGDGAYGVEAAAEHYFSVHASRLTLHRGRDASGAGSQPERDGPRPPSRGGDGTAQRRARPHARPRAHQRGQLALRREAAARQGPGRDAATEYLRRIATSLFLRVHPPVARAATGARRYGRGAA